MSKSEIMISKGDSMEAAMLGTIHQSVRLLKDKLKEHKRLAVPAHLYLNDVQFLLKEYQRVVKKLKKG